MFLLHLGENLLAALIKRAIDIEHLQHLVCFYFYKLIAYLKFPYLQHLIYNPGTQSKIIC